MIANIIAADNIFIEFQPIVSIVDFSVLGVEGLARGRHRETIIAPLEMFGTARDLGLTLQLDRLCQIHTLSDFASVEDKTDDRLLFINVDTSILDQSIGSKHIFQLAKEYGLSPERVVLEINESSLQDAVRLERFTQFYQEHGFLIALDDIGSGCSNLDRIALTKPDFLKIDKQLIQGIHTDFHKQVVLESLVTMADRLGALVVAEGVETKEQLYCAMDRGVKLYQGYYFSHPKSIQVAQDNIAALEARMKKLSKDFQRHVIDNHRAKAQKQQLWNEMLSELAMHLCSYHVSDYNQRLQFLVAQYTSIECIYVLNADGIQVTGTILTHADAVWHNHHVFRPAAVGHNHTLKQYYYLLQDGLSMQHQTQPYISMATGNLCVTLSKWIADKDNTPWILCVDVVVC